MDVVDLRLDLFHWYCSSALISISESKSGPMLHTMASFLHGLHVARD